MRGTIMGTESSQETIQDWRQYVEAFASSSLTREAYSKENGLRIYQLGRCGLPEPRIVMIFIAVLHLQKVM